VCATPEKTAFFEAKNGIFDVKRALFGPKTGQKRGLVVTGKLLCRIYK
jgi:hypothetical protein